MAKKKTHLKAVEDRPHQEPVVSDVLSSPEEAVRILAEVAELNDQALDAHKRYLDLRDKAKAAKDNWEALCQAVQEQIRQAAHPEPLPLFDPPQVEADIQRMVEGEPVPTEEAPF